MRRLLLLCCGLGLPRALCYRSLQRCSPFLGTRLLATRPGRDPPTARDVGDGLSSRRDVLRTAAAAAAAVVIIPSSAVNAEEVALASAEAAEVPTPLRQRFYSKYDDRLKSANMEYVYKTFSPAFVAYLSRILLTFDPASKAWWNSVEGGLTAKYDADIRQGPAMTAFSDYVTSVQIGLENFEGDKGIRRLLKLLRQRYGSSPDAAWQLAVLFSLLEPSLQPVDDMADILASEPRTPRGAIIRGGTQPQSKGKGSNVGTTAAAAAETGSSGASFTSALKQVFGGTSRNLVRLLSPNDVALELAFVDRDGSIKPVPPPAPPSEPAPLSATLGASAPGGDASAVLGAKNAKPLATPDSLAAAALPAEASLDPDSTFYRLLLRSSGVASKVYVPPPAAFSNELEKSLESILTVDSFGGDLKRLRRDVSLTPPQMARFFAAGALCSSMARLFLTPIDVVKTKLQSNTTPGVSFAQTVKDVWKKSGLKGFFAGADTTVVGYFIGGAAAFGCTELLKRRISSFVATSSLLGDGQGLGPNWAAEHPVPITISAAATAMAVAVVLVMPFEAIRIRMVSSPKYANRNIVDVGSTIYREEGLEGFYAALPFFLLKDVPFFVVKFVVFDTIAETLTEIFPAAREVVAISLAISLTAGLVAGGTAALATHPFDSLMTLVNVKGSDKGRRKAGTSKKSSAIELILDDFKAAGPEGTIKILSRGVGSRFVFAAMAVAMQFFLYDFFKLAFQISAADLSLFWDVLGGVQQAPTF